MSDKYRIVEKEYEDGHKLYVAQEAIRLFGINIFWTNYTIREENYYGNIVRFICCGDTYEDCLEQLKDSIEEKKRLKKENTLKKKTYIKVDI